MNEASRSLQELFTAIHNSDIEQVKQLLTTDIVDRKDANGQTALTLASSIGNTEIIDLLISAGAKLNPPPEPLVFNPQISTSNLLGRSNLGALMAQAAAEAPEDEKNFYAGFMSVIDALSSNSAPSPDEIDDETSNEIEEADDDEEEDDKDESASTPLGAAVLKGDLDTVRILLAAGADPIPSVWYQTPVLVTAARKGYVEIMSALIAAGANVDRGLDELPLHTAAEEGHLEAVRLLLDSGANVEGYEEDGWTALMAASSAGHLSVVQLLVQRGADVNAWSHGETPLMLAARGVHRDIYQFLYPLVDDEIRAIGDRDAEREMARTLKRRSREQNKAAENLLDAAMYGKLKQVQELIASGVDINAIASCNRTALSIAIQGGHIPVIQALLDAGADPNLPDETDDGLAANSPLMGAASTFFATNRGEMVRLLLQRGADINQQDSEGRTALMNALAYSDMDVIQTLIEAGADLDLRDNEGNTALMQAEHEKLTKAANILKQAGASEQGLKEVELLQAVRDGDVEKVKLLLQGNINVNLRVGKTTALCQAACEGNPAIAKLLIAAGADVNKRESEGYFNPLEYAELGKRAGDDEGDDESQSYDEVIALLESYGATRSA